MESSLVFLYIVFGLSIIALTIAGILYAFLIIPLLWRLAKVQNGLKVLRRELLGKAILAELTAIVAIFCLTARFYITDLNLYRYIITLAIFAFSLTILGKAIFDTLIFRNSFSPQSIKLHARFERHERSKLDKKVKK